MSKITAVTQRSTAQPKTKTVKQTQQDLILFMKSEGKKIISHLKLPFQYYLICEGECHLTYKYWRK